MKSLGAMRKVGIVLLLLNEIRGVVVVLSVLAAWNHAGKAAPPANVSASVRLAPPTANALAGAAPAPVAPGPPRRGGS